MKGQNRPPLAPKIPGTDLRSHDVPVAIIYRPASSAMRSGPRPRHWVLEFEPARRVSVEPLMGWRTSKDPYPAIRITFPDKEAATAFAERQDWPYILCDDSQESSRTDLAREVANCVDRAPTGDRIENNYVRAQKANTPAQVTTFARQRE